MMYLLPFLWQITGAAPIDDDLQVIDMQVFNPVSSKILWHS